MLDTDNLYLDIWNVSPRSFLCLELKKNHILNLLFNEYFVSIMYVKLTTHVQCPQTPKEGIGGLELEVKVL